MTVDDHRMCIRKNYLMCNIDILKRGHSVVIFTILITLMNSKTLSKAFLTLCLIQYNALWKRSIGYAHLASLHEITFKTTYFYPPQRYPSLLLFQVLKTPQSSGVILEGVREWLIHSMQLLLVENVASSMRSSKQTPLSMWCSRAGEAHLN